MILGLETMVMKKPYTFFKILVFLILRACIMKLFIRKKIFVWWYTCLPHYLISVMYIKMIIGLFSSMTEFLLLQANRNISTYLVPSSFYSHHPGPRSLPYNQALGAPNTRRLLYNNTASLSFPSWYCAH